MLRRLLVALAVLSLLVVPGAAVHATGSAPGAPKILGPADGAVLRAYDEQVFEVSAVDPDRDRYTATVSVVDANGLTLSFSSRETASDDGVAPQEVAVARPPVELPDGTYTWTVAAVDSNGNAGPSSPARTFRVGGGGGGLGANPSDQCKQGRPMPVDGVMADGFVRVRERVVGDERWICVRTDDFGGRVVLRNLAGGPTAGTTTDANAGACGAAPDNIASGQRPLAAADDGSFVDVYQGAAGVWLCVQAGGVPTRLMWAAPRTVGATSIAFTPDFGGWKRPPLARNDAYYSGTCQAKQTNLTTVVNADIADGHLWIETQQDSPELTRLCFRTTNAAWTSPTVTGVRGGLMEVKTAPPTPSVQVADTWTGCNQKLPTFTAPELGSIGYTAEGTHGQAAVCWKSSLIGVLSVNVVQPQWGTLLFVE